MKVSYNLTILSVLILKLEHKFFIKDDTAELRIIILIGLILDLFISFDRTVFLDVNLIIKGTYWSWNFMDLGIIIN